MRWKNACSRSAGIGVQLRRNTQCDQAILFVDEMQRLAPDQLDAFAELHDILGKFQISLTTFFIGNDPECWKLIDSIDRLEKSHIHGRFFTHGHVFRGLTSSSQVAECLRQYDIMKYPEDGDTYVAYFLGKNLNSDWKLESLSHPLWECFGNYQKLYGLDSWGMQYFAATVNTLLCDYLPRTGVEYVDEDVIDECIRMSGLIPSLVHQST